MTDIEKRLLDNLKRYLEECKSWKGYGDKSGCPTISYTYDNANVIYDLIIKQEKVIDEMAEELDNRYIACPSDLHGFEKEECKKCIYGVKSECWKRYFYEKVERK